MRRFITTTGLLTAVTLSGCAHTADKTDDMLVYEEARDSKEGELIAERNPDIATEAQHEYKLALEAQRDNDPRIADHHTGMTNLHWRTATAHSGAADAMKAKHEADDRVAEAEVRLEEVDGRIALASTTVERLEKIAALQRSLASAEGALSSQKSATQARGEVSEALVAIKEAEAWGAREFAPDVLGRATTSLESATVALGRSDLDKAQADAKEATRLAKQAQATATPKFETQRSTLALDAKRRALFDAAKTVPGVSRRMTEGAVNLTLYNLFPSGEVLVSSDKLEVLDGIEQLAKAHPEFTLVIEGHTDDRGSASRNLTLSQGRAQAILSYLSKQGVSPLRMTSTGKGSGAPIANNGSKAGRAENRRIELIFVQPS